VKRGLLDGDYEVYLYLEWGVVLDVYAMRLMFHVESDEMGMRVCCG